MKVLTLLSYIARSLALLALLSLGACTAERSSYGPADAAEPPNIVLIVADDLGYGDLGAYGQEQIQTPRLDQMAAEGLRFTDFYAGSTVCAPSRSVLMTGQHAGHTPIRGNREVMPIGQEPLPTGSVTIAEILQDAGYATGAFGKWGLGAPGTEGVPTRQGFDTFFGYLGQRRAHFYYPEFLFRDEERVPLEGNRVEDHSDRHPNFSHPGSGPALQKGTYSHDAIAEEALAFVEAHQDEPFFLFMPVTIPHAELSAPEDAMAQYLDENGESIFSEEPFGGEHYPAQAMPKATYAAMVSRMDRDVGRIMDKLQELGLAENTLVLFTSDNGPHGEGGYDPSDFDSNGPLRGMKRDLYEGGIRVPLIAWWPGTIEAATTSDHVGYFGDFMTTFADLADVRPPEDIDSRSLVPTLLGQPAEQRQHEYLYWEFHGGQPAQAVRKGMWKAVRVPAETGEIELFNLEQDLKEERNVAASHPEIVAEMERIMAEAHEPNAIWAIADQ